MTCEHGDGFLTPRTCGHDEVFAARTCELAYSAPPPACGPRRGCASPTDGRRRRARGRQERGARILVARSPRACVDLAFMRRARCRSCHLLVRPYRRACSPMDRPLARRHRCRPGSARTSRIGRIRPQVSGVSAHEAQAHAPPDLHMPSDTTKARTPPIARRRSSSGAYCPRPVTVQKT